jgi:hypothetical protein
MHPLCVVLVVVRKFKGAMDGSEVGPYRAQPVAFKVRDIRGWVGKDTEGDAGIKLKPMEYSLQ